MSVPPAPTFVIKDLTEVTAADVTKYLYSEVEFWRKHKFRDWALWDIFRGDFVDWTADMFNMTDNQTRTVFRNHLVCNGVYMTPIRGRGIGNIGLQLMEALKRG